MTMDREKEVLERILGICESKGYNKSEFARHLGMGQRTVNGYLNGSRKISFEFIRRIVSTFDVDADWLITGKGGMPRRNPPAAVHDPEGIPLYRLEAAVGFGDDNFRIGEKDIEARYGIKELEPASFMLRIRDDAMAPTYVKGDLIAVQTVKEWCNIRWGKPYLVSSGSKGLLVRRIYDDGAGIIAVSDNPAYRSIRIDKGDVTGIAVVKGGVRFEND